MFRIELTANENQSNAKFLHLERDLSDMQLRYHQLCSLASNIPSELRVAPRSTPELPTSDDRWLHCLSRLLHRWHCEEHTKLVLTVVQRCHCTCVFIVNRFQQTPLVGLQPSDDRCHYLLCRQPSNDPSCNNNRQPKSVPQANHEISFTFLLRRSWNVYCNTAKILDTLHLLTRIY